MKLLDYQMTKKLVKSKKRQKAQENNLAKLHKNINKMMICSFV